MKESMISDRKKKVQYALFCFMKNLLKRYEDKFKIVVLILLKLL